MHKAKWMGRIIICMSLCMLLSSAGLADEANPPNKVSGRQMADSVTLESLLADSAYAPRWQLYHPVKAETFQSTWRQPIADVDFQDNSALGRVSKLRNLSLLTLAETGKARLFLGVNDDGLVGLHFIAVPKRGDNRYLSLARMPYLKKDEPHKRTQ